jgi:hypothetical protein
MAQLWPSSGKEGWLIFSNYPVDCSAWLYKRGDAYVRYITIEAVLFKEKVKSKKRRENG